MNWWQKLKKNSLARWGATFLGLLYGVAIAADFIAPYSAYSSQLDSSLLPPTKIYASSGETSGLVVYPTTQGPTSIATGERELKEDRTQPAKLGLLVKGEEYRLFNVSLPLPPSFAMVNILPGIPCDRHLFGTDGPARVHLFGTDEQGRDQFSRLVIGSRISLSIGLIGIMVSFPIGLVVGGIAGYFGGLADTILMRLVEVLMSIPGIYLLVALAAVLPSGLSSGERFLLIVLITSLISWSGLARVIRGQVLSIKKLEFVQAAQAMGANPFYIILRHILPQTSSYVVISSTLAIPSFIVAESVLSLIGLGIQQPDPSWGNLLSLASNASILVLQPWLIWPPALLIIMTVLSFNLLGDGLRDALDPKSLS